MPFLISNALIIIEFAVAMTENTAAVIGVCGDSSRLQVRRFGLEICTKATSHTSSSYGDESRYY